MPEGDKIVINKPVEVMSKNAFATAADIATVDMFAGQGDSTSKLALELLARVEKLERERDA